MKLKPIVWRDNERNQFSSASVADIRLTVDHKLLELIYSYDGLPETSEPIVNVHFGKARAEQIVLDRIFSLFDFVKAED